MNTKIPLLLAAVFLFSLPGFLLAQDAYTPKAGEEMYGTWTNDKTANYFHIQKKVIGPDGTKEFREVSDTVVYFEEEQHIFAKWTDSEGNIWYKIFGEVKTGSFKGAKWQELEKLSESATVCEYVYILVSEFDPANYPTRIGPFDSADSDYYRFHYLIFYRSNE